jgi:hypothetical protein
VRQEYFCWRQTGKIPKIFGRENGRICGNQDSWERPMWSSQQGEYSNVKPFLIGEGNITDIIGRWF